MSEMVSLDKIIEEDRKIAGNTVNHPPHYNLLPTTCKKCGHPIECIDVVRHMNFNRGNAVKYIWRAGAKNPHSELEDLEKAIWYLQDEIKRLVEQKERMLHAR